MLSSCPGITTTRQWILCVGFLVVVWLSGQSLLKSQSLSKLLVKTKVSAEQEIVILLSSQNHNDHHHHHHHHHHRHDDENNPGNNMTIVKSLLRFRWGHLELHSPLARAMAEHQADCRKPLADFRFRNRFGLGSDLHLWSVALCNAMELNVRVVTHHFWIYWDQNACRDETSTSCLACYFGRAEMMCGAADEAMIRETEKDSGVHDGAAAANRTRLYQGLGRISQNCTTVTDAFHATIPHVRAAAMEMLFASVTPVVVQEAERQLQLVFGTPESADKGSSTRVVPSDLITVHIRWGDKADEMDLVPIQEYVQAVQQILNERNGIHETMSSYNLTTSAATAHIFLATEDPVAVQAFRQAAPSHWNIYVDAYFEQFLPHRLDKYNGNPQMSKALKGAPGLAAIASILVALEANDFVLTTASNWSRLINELRKTIVEPRIHRPTRMIDLKPGEW